MQAGGALLFLWARLTFGWRSYHVVANPTEGGLVTSGPYRYIRHPIYTAMSVLSAAGVVAHWSWASGLLGGLVLGSALLRIFSEEVLVTARYPEYGNTPLLPGGDSLRVLILEQGRPGFDASSIDRNHKLTGGVAVIHENLHLLKVLVAAQLSGAFDGPQISRRFGFANPVLPARVVKADSGVSQDHSHAGTSSGHCPSPAKYVSRSVPLSR